MLWHVLEHMPDPAAALERVRSWLAPSGVLLVAVPNLDSLQARLAGPKWFHLDLPRHRTHFTARGALRAARRGPASSRSASITSCPSTTLHGMWLALLGRLGMTPGFPFHLLKRNVRAIAA